MATNQTGIDLYRKLAPGDNVELEIEGLGILQNTIGSKANDSLISRDVVTLKAELEKFREQAQNVE